MVFRELDFIKGRDKSIKLGETHLMVTLSIIGNWTAEGDTFIVKVIIKNRGKYKAVDVRTELATMKNGSCEPLPPSWRVIPKMDAIEYILPKKSHKIDFRVTRGPENVSLVGKVMATNAKTTYSNIWAIPIYWGVYPVVLLIALFSYKKWLK
jgi:hypothetical protein